MATQRKILSVCELLACVMVNEPFATALTYPVPLAISVAALAVVDCSRTVLPELHTIAVTSVEAAFAVSVTSPVAFDLPSPNWRTATAIRLMSVSFDETPIKPPDAIIGPLQ